MHDQFNVTKSTSLIPKIYKLAIILQKAKQIQDFWTYKWYQSLDIKGLKAKQIQDFWTYKWYQSLDIKGLKAKQIQDFWTYKLNHRVKTIRSDNGTEFKNREMLEFYGNKGIKQEYSNARTPQQNGVAERMNRTLIKAARTMLTDLLLPITFWAEAVSTACYIFNRISREDLTELYRIVMKRYGTEGPTDDYERVFWENLKIMLDAPLSTDLVWSLPERKYPLSANVCQTMLKMKLLDGKMNEDCYKLLKMMEKQAGV
ncbi:putative ribonuclease H-like domain-containing protein [Tanacetum coccineum]